MSLDEFQQSLKISAKGYPFYSLIMAAMRKADTENLHRLKRMWPDVWQELEKRYWAAGGKLPTDDMTGPTPEDRRSEDPIDRRQREIIVSYDRREEGRDRRG